MRVQRQHKHARSHTLTCSHGAGSRPQLHKRHLVGRDNVPKAMSREGQHLPQGPPQDRSPAPRLGVTQAGAGQAQPRNKTNQDHPSEAGLGERPVSVRLTTGFACNERSCSAESADETGHADAAWARLPSSPRQPATSGRPARGQGHLTQQRPRARSREGHVKIFKARREGPVARAKPAPVPGQRPRPGRPRGTHLAFRSSCSSRAFSLCSLSRSSRA